MDSMPFLHANRIFTIFFVEDLTFAEVRQILDDLLDCEAFNPVSQERYIPYEIHLEHSSFSVWVSEMDVIIRRD